MYTQHNEELKHHTSVLINPGSYSRCCI